MADDSAEAAPEEALLLPAPEVSIVMVAWPAMPALPTVTSLWPRPAPGIAGRRRSRNVSASTLPISTTSVGTLPTSGTDTVLGTGFLHLARAFFLST